MYISRMATGRLRAPNDDDAAGSGGGSNGDSDGAGQYVTRDELAQIVNQAVSGHVKRLEKRLAPELASTIVAQLKSDMGGSDDDGQDDHQDDDGGSGKAKASPEVVALKRQISALSNKLTKAEEARASEATQRRRAGLQTEAQKLLAEAGISGRGLKGAMAELFHSQRVKLGEDGSHLFEDEDGTELPLSDGLKTWAASDEAKLYLPPRDVRGSGDKGRGSAPQIKGNDTQTQAYQDALEGVGKFILNQ